MSDETKAKPKVPEGKASYMTTRQKEPNEKGFIGYETNWEPWQKEVDYTTPQRHGASIPRPSVPSSHLR